MADKLDYQKLLTEFIQKQMVVFGPNIILDKAKNVAGLSVDAQGRVLSLAGDGKLVLKGLLEEFGSLSEPVTKMVLQTIVGKYPSLKE